MLITKEVTGTQQLDVFMDCLESSSDSDQMKADIRRQILTSLAQNLRKIHDAKFHHDDFKWHL